jgi:nucleoside-diphosphate-sugar epimerase
MDMHENHPPRGRRAEVPRPRTALVVGARGGWGGEMVSTLLARGWQVRALARGAPPRGAGQLAHLTGQPAAHPLLQWVSGDAMRPDDLQRAAEGVQVLVHAVNPPGYVRWHELAMPMLRASMAAAQAQGARLMLPGNVYNYGPDAGTCLHEDAPQRPLTRKGRVRVEMEDALQEAAARHGLRSLVLRAGDFFGGGGASSWFNTVMVRSGKPVSRVAEPHAPGVGHTWAYLPDATLAAVRLLELDATSPGRLALAERVHFKGHALADGRDLARCVAQVLAEQTGRSVKISPVPWPLWKALALVSPMLREVREMRYLWQQPLALDNRRLMTLLGDEPHTPLPQAVAAALMRMGCLPTAVSPGEAKAASAH